MYFIFCFHQKIASQKPSLNDISKSSHESFFFFCHHHLPPNHPQKNCSKISEISNSWLLNQPHPNPHIHSVEPNLS